MSSEEKKQEDKPKRKYVRRTPLKKTTAPEEKKEEEVEECAICLEECKQPLACNHYIHARCIALSGQNTCSICRASIQFSVEDQREFQRKKSENEEEKKQREMNESLTLANQLQREINRGGGQQDRRQQRNTLLLEVYNRQYQVTLTPGDMPIPQEELMMQLNQVMVHVANNRRQFSADRRVIELYKVMMDMNRVSATTGVDIKDICNIFQTLN